MARWVYATEMIEAAVEAVERGLRAHLRELLQQAVDSEPEGPAGDGSFAMTLPASPLGASLTKRIRVTTGVLRRSGSRAIIPVTWHADSASALFPSFDGTIELEPLDRHRTQLLITGSYRPPLGPIGQVTDTVLFQDVAQHTVEHLAAGLRQALTTALREGEHPPIGPRYDLALTVADVMTPRPVVLDAGLSVRTAALILFHADVSGAPVIDADGSLIGVLSEEDLLAKEATERYGMSRAASEEHRRRTADTVGEACSRPARTTAPDAPLSAAVRTMLDHGVSRLIVIDGAEVAGILTRHDVLAALLRDDASIRAAVEARFAELGAEDVQVSVSWGVVHLEGRVSLRSTAAVLPAAAREVDGVMGVEDDLEWVEDDVLPPTRIPTF
jgi:CBS domain-containing protein